MSQSQQSPEERLHVMMVTEGTYPYHFGGVSTWCHLLLKDLSYVDFTLVALAADATATLQFALPANVIDFRPIGLWDTREAAEARRHMTVRQFARAKSSSSEEVIGREFIPEFQSFLHELYALTADLDRLASAIHGIYRFSTTHDFDRAMRSQAAWTCFLAETQAFFPPAAARNGYPQATFNLADLTAAMQWLYHWLFPLAQPLPRADVVHAAMAGICTLVAAAVKLEYGTPYMLTEHGIYLRERYLAEAASQQGLFRKLFNLQFALRMTELSYALADLIAPCCDYNQRWELRNGARPAQIKTIYYGVDSSVFTPAHKAFGDPPTVVWVGRIDPLKDLLTLIRAAGVVHAERPDIKFELIGSAPAGNEGYYAKCLALRAELGLEEVVNFAGFRANPAGAYNEADVVVLSSVSEAFPFSILEAMLCEKPIVATAVGGIPEQVAGCGYAVEPRNPEDMARAILTLMNDPELAQTLGRNAREKAVEAYGVRQSGMAHEMAYRDIIARRQAATTIAGADPVAGDGGKASAPGEGTVILAHKQLYAAGTVRAGGSAAVLVDGRNGSNGEASSVTHNGANGHEAATNRRLYVLGGADPGRSAFNGQAGSNGHGGSNGHLHLVEPAAGNGNGTGVAERQNGDRPESDHEVASDALQPDWSMQHAAVIEALAEDIDGRVPFPINGLEVTALLESMGITDKVASERYGAPTAFDLGYEVLAWVRARRAVNTRQGSQPGRQTPTANGGERLSRTLPALAGAAADYARGGLLLILSLSILSAVAAFGHAGEWSVRRVLVLSLGFSASQLVTSGFILGFGRRMSIYLVLGKRWVAGRFFVRSIGLALIIVDLIILLLLILSVRIPGITDEDRLTFVPAFLGLSVLWLVGGGLSLVRKTVWLALALVAGLGLGMLVDGLAARFTASHLALGGAAGFAVAVAVLLVALYRSFFRLRPGEKRPALHLPPLVYMLHEAAPYFGYSFLYLAFILVPHLLAWTGALPAGLVRIEAVTRVEVGLTLALLPLMLSAGVLEHAVMEFWRFASKEQAETPGNQVARFPRAVAGFYFRHWGVNAIVMTILSLAALAVFQRIGSVGVLAEWVGPTAPGEALSFFALGLGIYWLLGWGLFNCTFCITLGCVRPLVPIVLLSLDATLMVGVPLTVWLGYSYAVIAFVAGAIVFVLGTQWVTRRVLVSSDYHYEASV